MQDFAHVQIRDALLDWRESMAQQLGLSENCARNSMILHDIYVDAIAEQAHQIHSLNDLYRVAYYWKHIDFYGAELFCVIRDFLGKRSMMSSDDDDSSDDIYESSAKRVRTHL